MVQSQGRTSPDCGHGRVKIGEEVSEQLEYVPASLFV
ncbi:MAG: IS66 family transposase zinc-finger binding domain-containing protein, partial [Acidobacteriota bacterium]